MSIDQSNQPPRKTLISKLSSRSRRRRGGPRKEEVPLPSFSFNPSQQQENQSVVNDGTTSDRQQTKVEGESSVQGQLEGSGKENAPDIATASNSSTRTDVNVSSDEQIISRKVTDDSEQQTNNAAVGIQSASAPIAESSASSSLGIDLQSTRNNSNAVDKSNLSVKESSSSMDIPSTTMNTTHNSIDYHNCSSHDSRPKYAENQGGLGDTHILCQTLTTSRKRKFDSTKSDTEDLDGGNSAHDIDASITKQNTDGSKIASAAIQNNDAPLCKSSIFILDDQNSKQPCTGSSSEEVEITIQPAKASKVEPRRKSGEKKSCSSKQMKTKKEIAKNKRKKSAPNEVIEIDSDSDSSSCNLTRKQSSTKKATPKQKVKVEKKVKMENKESTKPLKQKSTGNQSKSSSSRGKKLCHACSTCKCNSRDGTSATPTKDISVALSGSHARQERALINRLQKIERNVQWMESQKYDVSRQLMKHRKLMTKKWEEVNPLNSDDKPKFLADILLDDKGCDEMNKKLCSEEVAQANFLVFGETQGMY